MWCTTRELITWMTQRKFRARGSEGQALRIILWAEARGQERFNIQPSLRALFVDLYCFDSLWYSPTHLRKSLIPGVKLD